MRLVCRRVRMAMSMAAASRQAVSRNEACMEGRSQGLLAWAEAPSSGLEYDACVAALLPAGCLLQANSHGHQVSKASRALLDKSCCCSLRGGSLNEQGLQNLCQGVRRGQSRGSPAAKLRHANFDL